MKKLIYNSLLLGGMLLVASCSNSEYEVQNLVPEKYHKILYVNNNGKQEMNMNTVETTPVYPLRIVKAGSDPNLSADVNVVTMSQEEVDELYNDIEGTNYQVIPSNTYSYAAPEITFQPGEVGKRLDVTFHSDLIYEEMQRNAEVQYVLPVKITSDKDSINVYKNHVLLLLDVKKPVVTFKTEKITSGMVYKQLDVNVKADLNNVQLNKWDFTCSLTDAQKEVLVNEYNTRYGTNYLALPTDAYKLKELTFVKGNNVGDLNLSISRTSLTSDKTYLLPLKLSDTSQEGFELGEDICYLVIDNPKYGAIECDRSKWKVVFCNSDDKNSPKDYGDKGGVESLFDNNVSTYWHSNWSGDPNDDNQDPQKFEGTRNLPYTIVAETNEPIIVHSIAWCQRGGEYKDTQKVEYFISNDKEFKIGKKEDYTNVALNNWSFIATGTYEKAEGAQWHNVSGDIMSQMVKGHLLKIKIVESRRDTNASGAELYVRKLITIDGEPIK